MEWKFDGLFYKGVNKHEGRVKGKNVVPCQTLRDVIARCERGDVIARCDVVT